MKQLIFASLLLCFSNIVAASESVGKVILSFGQNYAVDAVGKERLLKRQAELYADDLLKTGDKGRLQVRFSDGSRLSLKPQTEFRIAEYSFDASNPEEGKALYKLLKGGMRTISGKIGKVNKENYKLETVVATIGIRGTHYGTEFTPTGLYTETLDGKVVVETDEGIVEVNAGESVSVNARTGGMTKGKATGQTSQGEGEESSEGEVEEEGVEESSTTEEGSSEGITEETSEDTASKGADDGGDAGITDGTASTDAGIGTDTTVNTDSGSNTGATTPAQDPSVGNAQPILASPDPTGNGTAAPEGAVAMVAFIEDDSVKGKHDSNGAVYVNDTSAVTIDSTTGQDRVTGILYVDNKASSSDNCNPCTVSAPADQSEITDAGTVDIGGSKVSWGRWNKDTYTLVETGTTQNPISSFHYLYSENTTPANVIAAKTGSYVYTFSNGNPATSPEFQSSSSSGELVAYDAAPKPTLRIAGGTYMQVDWDSQKITEISITVKEKIAGNVVNTYLLTEEQDAVTGAYQDVSLSTVLNGGEIKLQGSCSGSGSCGTSVPLSGRANMEFVGNNADGAAISYGASGSSSGTTTKDVSVVGTAVLQ